jgi:hypothetical protein
MTDASAVLLPESDSADDRRAHQRRTVILRGCLYQRGKVVECVVNNLSAGGAGLIFEVRLLHQEDMEVKVGAMVTLTIDRYGDLPGTIAWNDGQYAGIQFLQEPDQVRLLTEKLLPDRG